MNAESQKRKRIAIVSTWFLPQQRVATNRILAFAIFLSEDYEVEVFAMDKRRYSKQWSDRVLVHYQRSNRILDWLKSDTSTGKWKHKAKTAAKVLLTKVIRNPLTAWQRATSKKLSERHQEHAFDLVISSFSPQEAHLAVYEWMQGDGVIPWVADMRDEMSANPYLSSGMKKALREVERKVNASASAITSVSKPILDDFVACCPSVMHFKEIRNGFNHEFKREIGAHTNERFSIGYLGTFYGRRKPDHLFKALVRCLEQYVDFDFVFHIVGAHSNFDVPYALQDRIVMHPTISYHQSITRMAEMDLNVVMHPASVQKGIFTGKLFDYISVQQPVLALVDITDVAAQLVRDFDCGYVAEFNETEAIQHALKDAFDNWKQGRIKYASDADRDSLHRKYQVDLLKELIARILENEGTTK